MKSVLLCISLICTLTLPGCIVQDIHDQIALSNENLTQIGDQLEEIDDNLLAVEGTLSSMDEQLAALQTQLDATNAHLASLRKTINNIDSTIPFLKISGDDEEAQAELEGTESVPTPVPTTDPEK